MIEPIVPEDSTPVKPEEIVLIVQYPASDRYIRGQGTIVEVQINGHSRPPRNADPDQAYRWLDDNGYRPAGFQRLDRPGTTFYPRRRQVYRQEARP